MSRMYRIYDDSERYNERDSEFERAFKEGYECGKKKAMREMESYNERSKYDEGFEEKIEKLKRKYE